MTPVRILVVDNEPGVEVLVGLHGEDPLAMFHLVCLFASAEGAEIYLADR